jgi:hypothetical protein
LKPNLDDKNWDLVVNSDSDWARDVKNCISLTRFIIYLLGVPICWRSKGQNGTLSSSEAEYMAMSEAVKEIRFIFYLLRDVGIPVKLPIMVRNDNIGAMFMAEKNASSDIRTRHIDTRYHFIREHVEDGFIKIVFVKIDNNHSDLFTKNSTRIPTRDKW